MVETLRKLEILISTYESLLPNLSNDQERILIVSLLEDCRKRYHLLHNARYRKKDLENLGDYESYSS